MNDTNGLDGKYATIRASYCNEKSWWDSGCITVASVDVHETIRLVLNQSIILGSIVEAETKLRKELKLCALEVTFFDFKQESEVELATSEVSNAE